MFRGLADAAPIPPAAPVPASPPTTLDSEISGFLLQSPQPTSTDVANFLKLYAAGADRNAAAQALLARGISAVTISSALTWLDSLGKWHANASTIGGVLAIASAAACGFHGYRRNGGSIPWAAFWFVAGGIFPIFSPVLAISQGFAKSKRS